MEHSVELEVDEAAPRSQEPDRRARVARRCWTALLEVRPSAGQRPLGLADGAYVSVRALGPEPERALGSIDTAAQNLGLEVTRVHDMRPWIGPSDDNGTPCPEEPVLFDEFQVFADAADNARPVHTSDAGALD